MCGPHSRTVTPTTSPMFRLARGKRPPADTLGKPGAGRHLMFEHARSRSAQAQPLGERMASSKIIVVAKQTNDGARWSGCQGGRRACQMALTSSMSACARPRGGLLSVIRRVAAARESDGWTRGSKLRLQKKMSPRWVPGVRRTHHCASCWPPASDAANAPLRPGTTHCFKEAQICGSHAEGVSNSEIGERLFHKPQPLVVPPCT